MVKRRTGWLRAAIIEELLEGNEDGYSLSVNTLKHTLGVTQQSANRTLRQLVSDGIVVVRREKGVSLLNHMTWQNEYVHIDRHGEQELIDRKRSSATISIDERIDRMTHLFTKR